MRLLRSILRKALPTASVKSRTVENRRFKKSRSRSGPLRGLPSPAFAGSAVHPPRDPRGGARCSGEDAGARLPQHESRDRSEPDRPRDLTAPVPDTHVDPTTCGPWSSIPRTRRHPTTPSSTQPQTTTSQPARRRRSVSAEREPGCRRSIARRLEEQEGPPHDRVGRYAISTND